MIEENQVSSVVESFHPANAEGSAASANIVDWSPSTVIAQRGTAACPAIASLGSKTLMVWRGDSHDTKIWYSVYDGTSWTNQAVVPSASSPAAPAIAEYNGKLYMVWKGEGVGNIYYAYNDGQSWSSPKMMPNARASSGPALAVALGNLYMVWQGSNENLIWYANLVGDNWTVYQKVPTATSWAAPTISGFAGKLYMAWKDTGSDHILWNTFDGINWSGAQQVPNVGTSASPSLSPFSFNGEDSLCLVWKGSGSDTKIWYTTFDGKTWSPQTVTAFNTGGGPFVGQSVVGNPSRHGLMLTWQATDGNGIVFATSYGDLSPYANPFLSDPLGAFKDLPAKGEVLNRFKLDDWGIFTHIEGMAKYGSHFLFTHSQESPNKGFFVFGDMTTNTVKKFDVDSPAGYHHPSSLQVIGNYAVMGLEPGDKDNYHAKVYFYDLQKMLVTGKAEHMVGPSFDRTDGGAAAVGICYTGSQYVLAVFASSPHQVAIYTSNDRLLGDPSLSFAYQFSFTAKTPNNQDAGYDNMVMFSGSDGTPYLVGMTANDDGSNDHADMFRIDMTAKTGVFALTRNFDTGSNPTAGAHFRWGSSLTAINSSKLSMYCSARNFDQWGLTMSFFSKYE